jgi:uncharacterized protein with FMN-binding domain
MRTIRQLVSASCVAVALSVGVPLFVASVDAQARPKNATAQCKDDTYSSAKTKQGACSKHGGVKTWFADEKAAPAAAPTTKKAAPGPAPTAAPKSTEAPATKAKAPTKSAAGAPENATAKCKDGTYSYAKQHSGACSHHGGVAEWYK